jgi:small subunit ribosomal protein S8
MSMTDPIANMLAIIRNGQSVRKAVVKSPSSNLRKGVLEVLKREGYIRDYNEANVREGIKELSIELKYVEGEPAIREISKVSTPGRRVYSAIEDLQKINSGLGISILSTSKGVMSDVDARSQQVGGEVLCSVF